MHTGQRKLFQVLFSLIFLGGFNAVSVGQGEAFDLIFYSTDRDTSGHFIKEILLHHDNDLFGRVTSNLNDDDSYTGGFLFRVTTKEFLRKPFVNFSSRSLDGLDTTNNKINNYNTVSLGAVAFTPFNLNAREVLQDDRPYGSHTYGRFGLISDYQGEKQPEILRLNKAPARFERLQERKEQRRMRGKEIPCGLARRLIRCENLKSNLSHRTDKIQLHQVLSSQYSFGVVGSEVVPVFQSYSHRLFHRPTPNGWPNQIGGGKKHFVFNYNLNFKYLLFKRKNAIAITRGIFKRNYYTWLYPYQTFDWNVGTFFNSIGTGFRVNILNLNHVPFRKEGMNLITVLPENERMDLPHKNKIKLPVHPIAFYKEAAKKRKTKTDNYNNLVTKLLIEASKVFPDTVLHQDIDTYLDNFKENSNYTELIAQARPKFKKKLERTLKRKKLYNYLLRDTMVVSRNEDGFLVRDNGLQVRTSRFFYNDWRIKLSLYAEAEGRAVIHNSMLQGLFFDDNSVHTIDYRHMNLFQLNAKFGFNFQFGQNFNLYSYVQTRSKEFLGDKKWHVFGGFGAALYLGD